MARLKAKGTPRWARALQYFWLDCDGSISMLWAAAGNRTSAEKIDWWLMAIQKGRRMPPAHERFPGKGASTSTSISTYRYRGKTEWEKSAISHVYIHIHSFLSGRRWMCGRGFRWFRAGTNIHEQNAVCSSPVARLRQNLHKFGIWKAIQPDGNDDESSTHLNTHFKQTGDEATMKMERPQSVCGTLY